MGRYSPIFSLSTEISSRLSQHLASSLCLSFPRPLPPSCRHFSLSAINEYKKNEKGNTKWKRGGLIQTTIYSGYKGVKPIPKPLFDFKSGDQNLEWDSVMPDTPQSHFRDIDFSVLDPMVQRILSAETSDAKDLTRYHQESMLDKVRRHPGDTTSLEVIITQQLITFKRLYKVFKRDKDSRKRLRPRIEMLVRHRYDNLMKLRRSDYDRFVWLCDVLHIDFKLKPDFEVELTEKEKILCKAQEEADALKQDKLLEYKKFLDLERLNFEEVKKETVEKLCKDFAQFGFDDNETKSLSN